MNTVLIIDDEEKLRGLTARIISLEGFEVIEAADGASALKKLRQQEAEIVLCDVKLPDTNGVELAATIKAAYPSIEIILLTAYGNIPDSVQAIKNGAFDYLVKGDDNNRIIPLLYRAVEKVQLNKRVSQLEKQMGHTHSFESLLGQSKNLQQAIQLAQKVAPTDTTVLLTGETGTGKEVFANAIHHASLRNKQNFVAINCSAFSKELLESELFGHKAGAFTGAAKDKKGLFEEANNGTLFMDELGEMSMDLQAKLLRVLENGEFIKVGESKTTRVNVRLITATNRNLQQEIAAGQFRQDLFYRLSAFQIQLPSLRERSSDIEILANYFAQYFAAKTNKRIGRLHPEFIAALRQHNWPGNIRELKNVIERSVILADDETLSVALLPFDLQQHASLPANEFSMAGAERQHIQKVLSHTNGNKTKAAELLGIALTTLYRKLEEYKL